MRSPWLFFEVPLRVKELVETAFQKGQEQNYEEAIAALTEATELDPSFAEAYVLRGHAQ